MERRKTLRKKWLILILSIVFLLGIGMIVVVNLSIPFTIHSQREEVLTFVNGETQLSGTLYVPKGVEEYPVVVFIHGDGPSDRTESGEYVMLINAFLNKGIACYSYDKPGIGLSSGNWLDQTMSDRAIEVMACMDMLQSMEGIEEIGVFAMSQGGWVVSEMALLDASYEFVIVISGAINWMEQGAYYDQHWMETQGYNEDEKKAYTIYNRISNTYIQEDNYEAYVEHVKTYEYDENPMTRGRFKFARMNMNADALNGISEIKVPFLGVFGGMDKNVDAIKSATTYKQVFDEVGKHNYDIYIYEEGNHSMLKSKYEGKTETLSEQIHLFIQGTHIYCDSFLEDLGSWVPKALKEE